MSISIQSIRKSLAARSQEPGILERLGARYYRHLGERAGTAALRNLGIDELPDDTTLQALSGNIATFAVIIAFAVGGLTTAVSVWVEYGYREVLGPLSYFLLYWGVLIAMLVVELAALYWLGLKTVHSLACLTGHHRGFEDFLLPLGDSVPNILARAALEVPDPVVRYLGIDPLKHLSKSKLAMVATLYKAKVVLSSMAVKYLLIRMGGKGGSRTAFDWVAIPITGFWDAFTLYKVAREARLRLFGLKLVEHIVKSVLTDDMMGRLSPPVREGAIRAVACIMVLAQNYHPNLLVLIARLSTAFDIREGQEYDDWQRFLALLDRMEPPERFFVLDLLSVSAAFDGRVSRMERHYLPQAFGDLTDVYMKRTRELTEMLIRGRLHAARDLCTLDFNPG